ncbi:MAG TPA: EAL domain-containing response regulator [Burkholderiaceae bacterium]|nr:EAL domain-containing response regulator [Burkholderiaceae bacterium]
MRIGELRFLAVEDHPFQRSVLMRLLTSLGATQICDAPDGHAALKILKTSAAPIDIIISDLDMPGMDGMEFMRHLGEARVAASIILASALESVLLASVETMSRAYGVRILGVIEKPITRAKLDALIGQHRPAQPLPPKAPDPSFTLEEVAHGLAHDEFEPFFQPKVELATGRVTGAEALARWRHPQFGVVAPSAFIGLLEAGDRIDALTWTMLEKSAAVCRQWQAARGQELAMSVNLSIRSLADVQLADQVTALVRAQQLEPRHMVLEITESAATTDVGKVLENLSRLRMKGFGLSIDDYGTGYSSMQQLMRIAFTELKIDQSFVANAARQQSASVILASSLDMAKKLNITSVAEGVETQQDWDLLTLLGCKLAQGYFIARPMPAQALFAWTCP